MDTVNALSQQWKERDNKVFSNKAEVKAKEMKEFTGTPKIDPLSRKIAEIVTQRELAALGIQPVEPVIRKPTVNISKPQPAAKTITPKPENLQKSKHVSQVSGFKKPDEKEPEPNPCSGESPNNEDIPAPTTNLGPPTISLTREPDAVTEEKKIEEDMMNNVEHIQAFQDELQREYPELGLNNSIEGSSFHTNELDELEEACKDFNAEQTEKKVEEGSGMPEGTDLNKAEDGTGKAVDAKDLAGNEIGSNNTERENSPIERKASLNHQSSLRSAQKRQEEKLLAGLNPSESPQGLGETLATDNKIFSTTNQLFRNKTEASYSLSKTHTKEFSNLQASVNKATFMHSTSAKFSKYTPRCHINLNNCKTSPIYFSVRVGPESRVKCGSGIGSVDSLRRILLRNFLDDEQLPKSFYDKNMDWVREKDERIRAIQEMNKDKDIEGCTFDPFFSKHEEERKKIYKFDYKATLGPLSGLKTDEDSKKPLIPQNTQKYVALSPAGQTVKYDEGFNVSHLEENGKILVPYKSINLLN